VTPLQAEGLDADPGGFGDPQPVEGQQRDERVLGRRPQSRGDQQRAKLVAVQPCGVGLGRTHDATPVRAVRSLGMSNSRMSLKRELIQANSLR
jgi:hypothetical protein